MKVPRSTALTVALILVAINVIASLWGLPLRVLNVACVLCFLFFIFSLSPTSFLGFALTLRDWGDIVRREMGQEDIPVNAAYRRAAVRSLAILTAVFLFGFSLEFTRGDDARPFLESMAVMTGAEAGFVIGYLVALRCYSSQA